MKFITIVSFLIFYLTSPLLSSNFQYIGDLQNYQQNGNTINFTCSNARVDITILGDGIVRVRMIRQDTDGKDFSYSILRLQADPVKFSLNEDEDNLEIKTSHLKIMVRKSPFRVNFFDLTNQLICKDDDSFGMGWNGSQVFCWKELHNEPFYGLGEKTKGLNKRGNFFTMWNSDIPAYTTTQDPLYQSHPFFISMHNGIGFGIFFDNSYRTFFNFGAGNDRFYYFGAEDGTLDYYFIYGPELKTVLRRYGKVVGTMPLPPKWSLGYQQCRWSYYPESEVMKLAQTFRDKQIPCDVIYLDIHYMDEYRVFTWHRERFPDPAKMIRKLKDMGFKVVVIIDPGIKVDPGYQVYQSGINGDHFCKYPDGTLYKGQVWPGWCHFPDFSKSDTRLWWGNLYRGLIDDGIAGFWNDMNEPATWGGTFPDNVMFNFEGKTADHLKMHNLYGFLMARSTYEGVKKLRPDERPFVLTRAGFAGVQRYAAVWTGDNVASWEHLKLSINMCLGLSMSGVAFCGPDIGGFMGAPTPELFTRWIQLGVFMPFFRTHTHLGSPDQEPWSYGEWHEEINKKFIRLRYELLPYLYNAFYQSSINNTPILKPMILDFQNDPRTMWMDDQFMVGEKLLVAPVYQENQNARKVYLPSGTWYDFWTDEKISGPIDKLVDAPLHKIPIFVRAGSLLPMQKPVNYVEENPLAPLLLHLYPGKSIVDSLYEDDGYSFDYQKGEFCFTHFSGSTTDKVIKLTIHDRIGSYKPLRHSLIAIIHDVQELPQSVKLNHRSLSLIDNLMKLKEDHQEGYYFDTDRKILYVKFADSGKELGLDIVK